ncbi:MAG: HTTM domain-containing protein [Bdellovibrionaceae bacterium]|nr:HTTM domain-containing protein [Pseudobdellovibrionaceae bacterium]
MKAFWNWWQNFWFAPQDTIGLAFMRIQLGLVMLYLYSIRLVENMDYFDGRGILPRDIALEAMPAFQRPPFSFILWPDSWAVAVHGIFVLLILLWTLGLFSRAGGWLIWVIHLGFLQRNYAVAFGADLIIGVLLFYLCFAQTNEDLSIKKIFFPNSGRHPKQTDSLSSAMIRLIQVHISVIYAYTGFEKLKGVTWWDGTALWSVLGNPQMTIYDMSFLRYVPWVVSVITFLTIVFEIYFPFAVAFRATRPWWLWGGILFHAGIGLLMGLTPFSLTMLSTYWLFLDSTKLRGHFIDFLSALREKFFSQTPRPI